MDIARDELVAFLIEAKRQTYAAGGGEAVDEPLLPGSRQLEYGDGAWLYRDVYYGGDFFVGQETVYHDGTPVWAMCYAGGILEDVDQTAPVYAFLQAALREVGPARPYRGPGSLRQGAYAYTDAGGGTVARFWGVEEIARGGQAVYRLRYSGGLLR